MNAELLYLQHNPTLLAYALLISGQALKPRINFLERKIIYMKKRLISILLALSIMLTLLPTSAFAAEGNSDSSGLTKLANPTELKWSTEKPGTSAWKITGDFQRELSFKIYRQGVSTPVFSTQQYYDADYTAADFAVDHFATMCAGEDTASAGNVIGGDWDSGSYYFTVQALGDGIQYSDSDEVSSENAPGGIYTYNQPTTELSAPENTTWNWPAANWNELTDNQEQIGGYFVEYGFSDTEIDTTTSAADDIWIIGSSIHTKPGQPDSWLQEELIGENGNGFYYFRVRALSGNIEAIRNSSFSSWSQAYSLESASAEIKNTLTDLKKYATESNVKEEVQQLNQVELENAMRADLNSSNGTVEALAELEKLAGGPAAVSVSQELTDFAQSDISVVGAKLNNTTGSGDITLNVGRAQATHVRDEMYDSTVAVDFSMTLNNAANPEKLDVPVKITLPIPGSINPEFLAILHYHADGTYEEVHTHCYQESGKWFVSFVLTSFSDFVITQIKQAGDPVTPTAPIFSAVPQTAVIYGKTVSELQGSDAAVGAAANGEYPVTGTVKYVSGWIDFSQSVPAEQTGFYAAISIPGAAGGKAIQGMELPTPGGTTKTYEDAELANAFTGGNSQSCCAVFFLGANSAAAKGKKITVRLKYDGDADYENYTFSFAGLTCTGEPAVDNITGTVTGSGTGAVLAPDAAQVHSAVTAQAADTSAARVNITVVSSDPTLPATVHVPLNSGTLSALEHVAKPVVIDTPQGGVTVQASTLVGKTGTSDEVTFKMANTGTPANMESYTVGFFKSMQEVEIKDLPANAITLTFKTSFNPGDMVDVQSGGKLVQSSVTVAHDQTVTIRTNHLSDWTLRKVAGATFDYYSFSDIGTHRLTPGYVKVNLGQTIYGEIKSGDYYLVQIVGSNTVLTIVKAGANGLVIPCNKSGVLSVWQLGPTEPDITALTSADLQNKQVITGYNIARLPGQAHQ